LLRRFIALSFRYPMRHQVLWNQNTLHVADIKTITQQTYFAKCRLCIPVA